MPTRSFVDADGLPVDREQAVYIQYGACLRQRLSDLAVFVFVGQAWTQRQ